MSKQLARSPAASKPAPRERKLSRGPDSESCCHTFTERHGPEIDHVEAKQSAVLRNLGDHDHKSRTTSSAVSSAGCFGAPARAAAAVSGVWDAKQSAARTAYAAVVLAAIAGARGGMRIGRRKDGIPASRAGCGTAANCGTAQNRATRATRAARRRAACEQIAALTGASHAVGAKAAGSSADARPRST